MTHADLESRPALARAVEHTVRREPAAVMEAEKASVDLALIIARVTLELIRHCRSVDPATLRARATRPSGYDLILEATRQTVRREHRGSRPWIFLRPFAWAEARRIEDALAGSAADAMSRSAEEMPHDDWTAMVLECQQT